MTKTVLVKNLKIGGGAPVSVQSMTTTPTADSERTLSQIRALSAAGCDLVRLAVTDETDVAACKKILVQTDVPLVADIQFDWRLAARCSEIGFAKVRFNPGNIGSDRNVESLVRVCKANGTPVRIGVNAGSLEKDLLVKYGRTPRALAESALRHASLLEKFGFDDIVLSVKSSDVRTTVAAYRILHEKCDYPLHLGVTESGAHEAGLVKSAIGIGALLVDGIGDTLRVSLTGDPVREAEAGLLVLRALRLRPCCEVVSCPTCSRCKVDLLPIVERVSELTRNFDKPLKIAVMGCAVNGPGEARDADFGVACGDSKAVLFEKGAVLKTVCAEEILPELKKLIEKYA